MIALAFSGELNAQALYDSYDDVRTVTYGLDIPFPDQLQNGIGGTEWPGWHGTLLQYYLNPAPDDVNSSAMCAQYSRNPAEIYDVILVNCGQLADLAPYLAGEKQMSMKIFSPVPGITVQISLQNAELSLGGYPAGRHSEYQAVTTTGGQWETLTFALTNQPWQDGANAGWWPDAEAANNDVDQMVILFNPGVNISETYYIDDLFGPERLIEPCTEVNFDPQILMDADCENNGWYMEYYDGRMSIFPDPALDQDDHCIEYARNGGAPDDVIVGNFNGALNIPPLTTLSIDVFDPAAPSQVLFSIQDAFGLELQLFEFTTTLSLQWETLTMDLTALEGVPNATDFVILIEPGQELAETFYLDNMVLETEVAVNEVDRANIAVYPNPSSGHFRVTGVEGMQQWQLFTATGALLESGNLSSSDLIIEVAAAGVYQLVIDGENGRVTRQLVVR